MNLHILQKKKSFHTKYCKDLLYDIIDKAVDFGETLIMQKEI